MVFSFSFPVDLGPLKLCVAPFSLISQSCLLWGQARGVGRGDGWALIRVVKFVFRPHTRISFARKVNSACSRSWLSCGHHPAKVYTIVSTVVVVFIFPLTGSPALKHEAISGAKIPSPTRKPQTTSITLMMRGQICFGQSRFYEVWSLGCFLAPIQINKCHKY